MMKKLSILFLVFLIQNSQSAFNSTDYKDDFSGQVGVVTGGSEGIGYETALLFARLGAKVVFCARDSNSSWFNGADAETTINSDAQVVAAHGEAKFFKADIRNQTLMREFVKFANDTYGIPNFAVNNAAIGGHDGNLHEIKDEWDFDDHDAMYNNFYGTYRALKAQVQFWVENGDKNSTYKVINLSSYNGIRACPSCSFYSASKHAIIGLTQSVALEYAQAHPKIRVNAVLPGMIDTSLTRNQVKGIEYGIPTWEGDYITETDPLWLKYKDQFASVEPVGRLGQPSEIALAIAFLASDRSSYVNGASWRVDGAAASG